jgi:RNA polymerase sigma-70 factor, ECF subfamily
MSSGLENEARWVELAAAGDFDSFAALYSCHLDTIYRYIYYRTADVHDAEDLTEQVFLQAWESMAKYRPVGSCFCNWLYRIAHNLVVDHHRRQKRRSEENLEDELELADADGETALEAVITAEECAALAAAVAQLPDDQQQVLLLRFIEGLGHTEIAQIINKSEGACRVVQYRALVALKKILSERRDAGPNWGTALTVKRKV